MTKREMRESAGCCATRIGAPRRAGTCVSAECLCQAALLVGLGSGQPRKQEQEVGNATGGDQQWLRAGLRFSFTTKSHCFAGVSEKMDI